VLNGKPTGFLCPLPQPLPRLQADSQDNEQRGGEEQTQGGVAPPTIGRTSACLSFWWERDVC